MLSRFVRLLIWIWLIFVPCRYTVADCRYTRAIQFEESATTDTLRTRTIPAHGCGTILSLRKFASAPRQPRVAVRSKLRTSLSESAINPLGTRGEGERERETNVALGRKSISQPHPYSSRKLPPRRSFNRLPVDAAAIAATAGERNIQTYPRRLRTENPSPDGRAACAGAADDRPDKKKADERIEIRRYYKRTQNSPSVFHSQLSFPLPRSASEPSAR